MPGRLEGKVCVITGAASGIGAETRARCSRAEGARVVGVDLDPGSEGELALQADVTDEEQVRGMYERARERVRPHRRPVQQRGHQPDRRLLGAGDLARGLAAGSGRQPAQRLPVLQARHPAPAGGRRRVGDQHGLVRRCDGRRGIADLLHRVEGRGAVAVAGAGGGVRAARRAGQRAVPGAGEHAAAPGAVRRATPRRRRAGSSTCPWGASPRPREIAQAALFLASDESSYVTASDLHGRRRALGAPTSRPSSAGLASRKRAQSSRPSSVPVADRGARLGPQRLRVDPIRTASWSLR